MTDIQLWLSAIEIGCFFGLVALGYLLILVGAGFFNFALGPYAMAAGMMASWLVIEYGIGKWLAIVIALLLAVALSICTELVVIRPVQARSGRGELPALVAVAAVLFLIQQGAGAVFGRRPLPGQPLLEAGPWDVGDATVTSTLVMLVVITAVCFGAVAAWTQFTLSGRMLRAVGDNKEAAETLGLPVRQVRIVAFALGGLIVGLAGIAFAPKAGVTFTSGLEWTLVGFLALVIGGTGRIWAPLIGGLLLGAVQVFTPYYIDQFGPETMLMIVAIIFFAFRPQGVFTKAVRV